MRQPKRWAVMATAAAIVATLWAATIVVAGSPVTTGQGSTVTRVKVISSVGAQSTSSTTFVDLVGANRPFQLTTSHLIVANFDAESTCFETGTPEGPNGASSDPTGACRVRIIATRASDSAVVELNAASGSNYGFDSFDNSDECPGGGCEFEGHEVERFATLPAGLWTIQVQFAVGQLVSGPNGGNGDGSGVFFLDDWHLSVERLTL